MAQSFSPKNYFKKIYSHEVLTEYYKRHEITAIFEIVESTPRKNVVGMFMDFYNSLSIEQKFEIEKELALVNSISTKYSPALFSSLLKEKKIAEEKQIECTSDHDGALYHYMFNREVFDEVLFFHDFYSSRGYMLYEAKEVPLDRFAEVRLPLKEPPAELHRQRSRERRRVLQPFIRVAGLGA